jgi:hypothetical protein
VLEDLDVGKYKRMMVKSNHNIDSQLSFSDPDMSPAAKNIRLKRK